MIAAIIIAALKSRKILKTIGLYMHDSRYIAMIVVAKLAVEWGFQMIASIAERLLQRSGRLGI